jgi:nicotinamidase-related amidase
VIVDVQKEFDDPAWGKRNNPGAEGNVARLLAARRAPDAQIIHVRHRETDPERHFFKEGDHLMHRLALARLHDGSADVVSTDEAIARPG